MGTNERKTGLPEWPVVDYEALIAERHKAGDRDGAARRAEGARLQAIAENLRTLRERADEQAESSERDP